MSANKAAYEAMVQKSAATGLPVHYRNDLFKFDKITLGIIDAGEEPIAWAMPEGSPFLWLLRDTGTDMIFIGVKEQKADLVNLETLLYREKNGDRSLRVFWWDGLGPGLQEIPLAKARSLLFEAFYLWERHDQHTVYAAV